MDFHAVLAATPAMLRSNLGRAALFGALWWLLTGGDGRGWGPGLAAVALALAASWRLRPPAAGRFSIMRLPRFLAFFLGMSLKSGLQVAAMALRPRLDLHPGMFALDLRLPEPAARVFLANTLNVLPGTLSSGLDGNRLLLHVLDRRQPIEREVRRAEARVAHLFHAELP